MKPKTIVISINASWNIFNFRRELIEALLRDGHRVVALAPEDEYSARLAALGAEFRPIRIDSQGVSPLHDLLLLKRYRSALRSIRPDLFLGYTIKPNIYGSLAASSLGVPVINNVSGLGTAFIRGGLLAGIATMLYRAAFRRSATVFFQNRDDRDLFLANRIVRPERARLLPGSGIDLERFRPQLAAETKSGSGPVFLFVGRLLWDKGVRELVDAARILKADFPNARFQLLGFVDAPNRSAVAQQDVDRWVREGVIEYLPACDDVRPHVAAADCVVLPSYREGLPRSLLEAAAMGKPLVATDVPGCRDIVEDGRTGLLCTVRDPASLAEAMRRIIEAGPEERARMGAAGRAKAEAEYDHRLVVDLYRRAINDALGSRYA